ncbi:class II peroxidase, partial [Laccaria amethystina LaAM-08-1]
MSFNTFRASLRTAAPLRRAAAGKALPRSTFSRKYSTPPPPPAAETPKPKPGSNTALYLGLAGVAAIGVTYYFIKGEDGAAAAVKSIQTKAKFVPTKQDYQKVYNRVAELLDEAGEYDDGSYGPVILRLAWHASGTYDKDSNTGGSNYATMRFEPESLHNANAGLNIARDVMEKVKQEFPWISYGDLWTLGGVAAIQEMGGPKIPWRPGRIDGFAASATPDGRLPDASQGSDHLRNIFYRMGFNDQEIVALSGAHALGRCHSNRSTYEGPWTFSPTTLTNDYFKLLFDEKWVWKKWNGPKQLEDKNTKSLMMLPTDYVLTQDKSFKKHAKAYADDQDLFFREYVSFVDIPPLFYFADSRWCSASL